MAEPGRPGAPVAQGAEGEAEQGRWGWLYGLVLGVLAVEIAGLWILEQVFR